MNAGIAKNADHLHQLIQKDHAFKFLKNVRGSLQKDHAFKFLKNVRGSLAYFQQTYDLLAMTT